MELGIAITTCPRDGYYVDKTLDSIHKAGFSETINIYAEPGIAGFEHVLNPYWHYNYSARRGLVANWCYAMRSMLSFNKYSHILYIEDDVEFRAGARERLIEGANAMPNAVLSLYTSIVNARYTRPVGWWPPKIKNYNYCGALAICFPFGILEALVKHIESLELLCAKDCHIHRYCVDNGIDFFCYHPTLVLHKGLVSTQEHRNENPERMSAQPYSYLGERMPETSIEVNGIKMVLLDEEDDE